MKNILRIFYFMLFLLIASCNAGGSDQTTKGGDGLVISTNLASISLGNPSDIHLGQVKINEDDQTHFIKINVNSQELIKLIKQNVVGDVKLSLSLADKTQNNLLAFSSDLFTINKKNPEQSFVAYLKPRDPEVLNVGGKVTILLTVQTGNQKVLQTSTKDITISKRTITLVDPKVQDNPKYIHNWPDADDINNQPLTISATSDYKDDNIDVSWSPANTNYIQSTDEGNSCTIVMKNGYGICAPAVHYNIVNYDDGKPEKYIINAFDSIEPTVKNSLPIQVSTSAPMLELTAKSNIMDLGHRSAQMHVKLLGKFAGEVQVTMALAVPGSNKLHHKPHNIKSGDITDYVVTEPATFTIKEGQVSDVLVKFKDSTQEDDIKENVGPVFTVVAQSNTATVKSSESLKVYNPDDYNVPFVWMRDRDQKLVEGIDIADGETQTFSIQSHRLDKDLSHVGFTIQGAEAGKINVAWDKVGALSINPNGAAAGDYTLVATLDGAPLFINGNIVSLPVKVSDKNYPKFTMTPRVKQVLKDYPSYYYIKIDNEASARHHQFKLNGLKDSEQLLLYVDKKTVEGCNGVVVNKINVNDAGDPSIGAMCDLSNRSTVSGNPCGGVLNSEMKLDKPLIFKVQLPDSYRTAGNSCQIDLKIGHHVFENPDDSNAVMRSVAGFNPITINANSGSFNNAHRIEMCATKTSDYNGCPLNKQLVTALTGDNLRNNSLFNPASLFEISSEYFDAGSNGGNTFTLRNYPGRNMLGQTDAAGTRITSLNLPQINLVLGYAQGRTTWNDDRCPEHSPEYPTVVYTNMGCANWHDLFVFGGTGVAYIPANNLVVTETQVNVNGAGNNLYIDRSWETDGYGVKNHSMRANGGFAVLFDLP